MPKLPLSCAAQDPLPPILRDASAPLLARFAAAVAANGIATVPAAVAQNLAAVFALSPFVAEVAIQAPARWLAALAPDSEFQNAAACRAQCAALFADCPDEITLRAGIRQHRTLALARNAWGDLLGERSLAEVLAELSALAEALVDTVAQWLYRDLTARFGTPTEEGGGPVALVVIAMGNGAVASVIFHPPLLVFLPIGPVAKPKAARARYPIKNSLTVWASASSPSSTSPRMMVLSIGSTCVCGRLATAGR